jgi:hypothetical protein
MSVGQLSTTKSECAVKRNGGMSQDLSVCRYALSPWS